MVNYTNNNPVFSSVIHVVETSDPAHANNINESPKQLLQNTLVLYDFIQTICDETNIEDSFYAVFTLAKLTDSTSMTSADIRTALEMEWSGESSEDSTALSSEDVSAALKREWNGETSEDETALQVNEIADVIKI